MTGALKGSQLIICDWWIEFRFVVASWIALLPIFQNIPLTMVLSDWKEVAFSNLVMFCIAPWWIPPPFGILKLNFDGSACGNPGMAGIGGLMRDSNDDTLFSNSGSAGFC